MHVKKENTEKQAKMKNGKQHKVKAQRSCSAPASRRPKGMRARVSQSPDAAKEAGNWDLRVKLKH